MKWHIWDFPDSIYVKFSESFKKKLYGKLVQKFGSRNNAAKKLGIHTTTLRDTLQRGNDSEGLEVYTNVKILKKILEFLPDLKEEMGRNIIAYRSRSGNSIFNPKLPIKESSELYSIAAHMICDGTAGKGKTPSYYNTSKELREEFIKNLQIFGQVKTNEYLVQSNVYAVMFPKAITDILSHIFQVKFVRTPNLPELFFKAPKECQYMVLRAMFDDEGCISNDQLTFTQLEIGIIRDLKILLENIGINTGEINPDGREYKTLTVLSKSRKLFSELVGFSHPQKNKRLETTVKADIIRRNRKPLIVKLNELFYRENNLTRTDICKKLSANINSVSEILYKLRKEGKLNSKFVGKNKEYLWSRASF